MQLAAVKNWAILTTCAGGTAAGVFLFWHPPPGFGYEAFAKWIMAAVLAILLPFMHRAQRPEDSGRWAFATSVSLTLSVLAFVGYDLARFRWIAEPACSTTPLVVGEEFLPHVGAFVSANPQCQTKECLIGASNCDPVLVWTKSSIDSHRLTLLAIYLISLPLFAVCMFCAGQTLSCLGRCPSPK
jgi:hypothetical protein